MATAQLSGVIQHLRRAVLLRDGAGPTDRQLLQDYLNRRDQAALADLVQRHGPMVWGVCRRVLNNYHDAEDAFQATFLVLVRRAASIASPELLANWLYGVAHQTAIKARATALKRKVRERQVTEMPESAVVEQVLWNDLQPLLDQELSRLPDVYRVVIVLCDLEGKTRKEAARHLGLPEGTVGSRLARARVLLAKRLAQRSVTVSAGALAAVLSQNVASAGVPDSVVSSTISAASFFAAWQVAATGPVSVKVAALTEGVLRAMMISKLKAVVAVVLVLGFIVTGATVLTYRTAAARGQEQKDAPKALPGKEPDKAKTGAKADESDSKRLQGTWHVIEMEEGGVVQPEDRFKSVKMRSVVAGNTLAIKTTTPDGRDVGQEMTFVLDEKAKPKRLDAQKDGRTVLGIYTFEKGSLKLCVDLDGKNRPSEFKTEKGSEQRLYMLVQPKDVKPKNDDWFALPGQDIRLVPGEQKSVPFSIEISHTKNGVEVKAESFRALSHTCTVDVGKQSLVLTGKAGQPVVLFRVPGVAGADPNEGQSKQLTGMRITVNLADGSFQVEGATNLK
jgi:RNA polymerase sigma factor (sigma-70 family)